jgi:hypothetical protein
MWGGPPGPPFFVGYSLLFRNSAAFPQKLRHGCLSYIPGIHFIHDVPGLLTPAGKLYECQLILMMEEKNVICICFLFQIKLSFVIKFL